MRSIVIVDDELASINYLSELLSGLPLELKIVGTAQNSANAVKIIEELKPDIVFMDIQLVGETGFDVLNKIKNRSFNLIFTTAHQQFAIKAIKFAALDYLLKPIDRSELLETLQRIQRKEKGNALENSFNVFLENFDQSKKKKIAISTVSSILVVEISEIICCQADGPYTIFILKNEVKPIVSSKHLKEYEELLNEHKFIRIHKSYLVNIKEVRQFIKSDGGRVLLSNDMKLDVSANKREELMEALRKEIHFLK